MSQTFAITAGRCVTRDGKPFVTINRVESGEYVDPAEADRFARLAAAAPEMLSVLEAFAELDDCIDQRDKLAAFDARHGITPEEGRYTHLYKAVRAAITKATGREI